MTSDAEELAHRLEAMGQMNRTRGDDPLDIQRAAALIRRQQAELAALRADAMRYRWLRANAFPSNPSSHWWVTRENYDEEGKRVSTSSFNEETLDRAIDSALPQAQP